VEVFLDDLETSNISKGSSDAPYPTIDYPSANSGSLATSCDNTRPRKADHRTCLNRRQRKPALDGRYSSLTGCCKVFCRVVVGVRNVEATYCKSRFR
jgi:hypothetical protein